MNHENLNYQPFSLTLHPQREINELQHAVDSIIDATNGRAKVRVTGRSITVSDIENEKVTPNELIRDPFLFQDTLPILVRGDAGSIFYWRIHSGVIEYKQAVILPADFSWVGTVSAAKFLELAGIGIGA